MSDPSFAGPAVATLVGRALRRSVPWAVLAGLAACIPATATDWFANPAGLFHGEHGTHWSVVLDTAWSWFWPVACAALAVVATVQAVVLRRARPGSG